MKFISYAQNFEDVMLWRALKRVKKGFYVDVGAQDPVRDSVSKAFYERDWHGINIEPVPFWFDKLSADRPRDINLRVAASSSDGEVTLYEVKNSGLSTMDVDFAKHYSQDNMEVVEHSIRTRTLTSILADAAVEEIHFLKVDVEGAEENVLRGMDFDRYRPWIILVEARLPNSTRDAFSSWESIIVSAEYTFAWDDGLNRFYYANEHSRLARAFRFPPNVFDQFVRYSESQSDKLARWAHELETKLAQAEASAIAAQAGLTEQLEAQQQDLLKLDAALQEAQASQSAVVADRDEVTRWAHELEAKLNQAEASSIAAQAGSAELLEAQHQDLLKLDAALQEARASQSAVVADRDELRRWAHELEAKLAQAEEQQVGLREQLSDVRSRYEEASGDNDQLRRAKQGLLEEVSRKEQEITLMEREAAAVARLLAAKIAEVERLYQSRSWRLTSPLRRVSGLLGAFRRRGISGTMKSIALRRSSRVGLEKMDSRADDKSSLPKAAPTIQDVLLSKHIESLEGVRRKIRQRLGDEDKGR